MTDNDKVGVTSNGSESYLRGSFYKTKFWFDSRGHNIYLLIILCCILFFNYNNRFSSGSGEVLYFVAPFFYTMWWYIRNGVNKICETLVIIRISIIAFLLVYIYVVWYGGGQILIGSIYPTLAEEIWIPIVTFLGSFFIFELCYSFFKANLKDGFWHRFIVFSSFFILLAILGFIYMVISSTRLG